MSTKQTKSHERQLSGVELAVATVAKWPMAVLDPNPKSTTDRYQVDQSNNGAIGIPRGVKERTFTAALAS
ncbi:MAG: hypothetical protein NDI90_03455 [Nitrospira sp. BO4]|nr:hypothetical protein [Nitrospira sp. BO4]